MPTVRLSVRPSVRPGDVGPTFQKQKGDNALVRLFMPPHSQLFLFVSSSAKKCGMIDIVDLETPRQLAMRCETEDGHSSLGRTTTVLRVLTPSLLPRFSNFLVVALNVPNDLVDSLGRKGRIHLARR